MMDAHPVSNKSGAILVLVFLVGTCILVGAILSPRFWFMPNEKNVTYKVSCDNECPRENFLASVHYTDESGPLHGDFVHFPLSFRTKTNMFMKPSVSLYLPGGDQGFSFMCEIWIDGELYFSDACEDISPSCRENPPCKLVPPGTRTPVPPLSTKPTWTPQP